METTAGGDAAEAPVRRADRRRSWQRPIRLLVGLALVNVLLLGPDWVLLGRVGPAWIALEACLLVLLFAALPRTRATRVGAVVAALVVVVAFVLEIGETTTWLSLSRPLNLSIDVWLMDSVHHLLRGALGLALALVVEVGAAAILAALAVLVAWLLVPRPDERPLPIPAGALVGLTTLGAVAVATGLVGIRGPVDAPMVRLVKDQSIRGVEMRREQARFVRDLAEARDSYADTPGILSRLGGADVILAFIESYGMTALEDPRYRPVVGPRLDDLQTRVDSAGLHLVSGRLVAPSQGGQSWFGHGSMLSGLWLDNQLRYDLMLASGRETLIDDFERAGYRTVALMPAIQMAWPEGRRFGYDEIFAFPDIEYAGPPLNWVTMPDQFTWSFLEHTIRPADPGRPLFAEVGFISSHAPWTPILPVLDDWESIGDGSVFAPWENAGERPRDLWRDSDRVREHYALSVEYAVHAMAAYAERYVDAGTLLIVLGDHQPAPLVTGEGASWEVPVHVISGDPELLEPFRKWGFVDGAWPREGGEVLGVDYFRDWFVRSFSGGGKAGVASRE